MMIVGLPNAVWKWVIRKLGIVGTLIAILFISALSYLLKIAFNGESIHLFWGEAKDKDLWIIVLLIFLIFVALISAIIILRLVGSNERGNDVPKPKSVKKYITVMTIINYSMESRLFEGFHCNHHTTRVQDFFKQVRKDLRNSDYVIIGLDDNETNVRQTGVYVLGWVHAEFTHLQAIGVSERFPEMDEDKLMIVSSKRLADVLRGVRSGIRR
jgi:hypothetical protein